jgi:hypothetical protein
MKQKPPIKEILALGIGHKIKWRFNRAYNGYGKLGARRCKCKDKPHLTQTHVLKCHIFSGVWADIAYKNEDSIQNI